LSSTILPPPRADRQRRQAKAPGGPAADQVDPVASVSDAPPGSSQRFLDLANFQKAQREEAAGDA